MTTVIQALEELESNGVAVYHHGTPSKSSHFVIDGAKYKYNKTTREQSRELRKAIKESYNKLKTEQS